MQGQCGPLWALLQRITILKFKDSQKKALRDEFGRLYFWVDGFYSFEGRLDTHLSSSSRLRYRVLSVLTEIGEILCNDRTGLFSLVGGNFGDEKLDQQRKDVQNLIEIIRETMDDEPNSGSDVSSSHEEPNNALDEIVDDLRSRNQCLADLSVSLDRPAPDADAGGEEAPTLDRFQVSTPSEIWTGKILDTNPSIDVTLAARLGEANWQRYQRISQKMEAMEDADSESENENDKLGVMPVLTENTKSTREQTSVFSVSGRGYSGLGATTATSVSNAEFDYSFPISRKRATAKDTRSQATYTSMVTDDQGERGWLRIPSLPIKEEDLGKAFRCTICGEKLHEIVTRTDWKKHIFADLEPYVCTFPDCEDGIKCFTTRKAWADHEFSNHRLLKSWTCRDCAENFPNQNLFRQHLQDNHNYSLLTDYQLKPMMKAAESVKSASIQDIPCPFCAEPPGNTNRAFAMHVSRHMEEISLAVIPRDSVSDNDHDSISSTHSLPAILDEPEVRVETQTETQLPANTRRLRLDDFHFLSNLGRGMYAKVMLCELKQTKQIYACKIFKKEFIIENHESGSVMVEKAVLKCSTRDKYPFIAHFFASFQTETRLYILIEYVPCGDLMHHIQRGDFGSRRARFYAAEFCLVLKYLHEQGFIYRHVKLENIMLDLDGHIKVIDFGLCKTDMWYGSTTSTFCSVLEYMAPEILLDKAYGRAVDWWAFGVLLYQMLLRQSPFRGEDEDDIFHSILADEPLCPPHMPGISVSILQKLLTRDPDRRLGGGPTDAQEVMDHAFFNEINWDDLYNKKITPPFIPSVANETDVSNFDNEFTTGTPCLIDTCEWCSLTSNARGV